VVNTWGAFMDIINIVIIVSIFLFALGVFGVFFKKTSKKDNNTEAKSDSQVK